MEEGAPSSVAWWKYLVWSALIVAVFGVSIAGGHWWSSRSYRAPQESANTASDTPTQRMPGSITLEVISELEEVRLQSSVDTAALAHWWQVLGVDSQALTFKELGGWATYTPHSVKIVIKDISPLSLSQRQALFNPVSDGLGGEPVAGSATVYDPAQPETLEYHVYHHPMLYLPEYSDTTEENINRVLFETLYVAVVGSTALTPDDYTAKRETAFPPGGGWQGIVKVVAGGDNAGRQSLWWHDVQIEMAEKVQRLRQWRLVPQAHAQSCGGTFYCGVSSTQCKCSSTNLVCTGGSGSSCGPVNNKGTCNCVTTCPSDPNLKTDCVKIGNTCGPRSNSCSNCVSEDFYTCAWSGPTPTTPATCGNGTCGSGESCSNCPADCGECRIYEWANINVLVYGENGLEAPSDRKEEPSSGNNTCKGYFGHSSTGKGWSNYNICQNIWLLDMAEADKSMYISGINSKYSGCRVELNGTVIDSSFANGTCSVPSRTYKQYDDRLVINLLKPTPTPTPCPAVTTPGGLTATYNGGANSTFGWNAVSNTSTPVTYGLQIDNYGSGWTSDTCAGTVQGGDLPP